MHVEDFLAEFEQWARFQPDIDGVALVGSYARGTATEGSDVDLLVLSTQPARYFRDQSWASRFGEVGHSEVEDWGKVESLRVHYREGLEVEYGFATREWGKVPIDEGTLRVVSEGMKILFDRQSILERVQREALEGRW